MAWIGTVPPDDADDALQEVYQEIGGTSGEVANVLRLQSLDPPALQAHYRLYRTLVFGPSPLSRAEREAIAVVVSATNGCHY